MIAGAPLFAQEIRDRVLPALQADIAVFNRWAELGISRPVDAAHLMVVLWASTQAYADFASQICLVLGKPELEQQDFDAAEKLLVDMVLRSVMRTSTCQSWHAHAHAQSVSIHFLLRVRPAQ